MAIVDLNAYYVNKSKWTLYVVAGSAAPLYTLIRYRPFEYFYLVTIN